MIPRKLGPLIAQVTIEESHHDELFITQHPVEAGAEITDHAVRRPAELILELGWSNSSEDAAADQNFVRNVYQALLDVQVSRQLIEIITGKRNYKNMLVASTSTVTNRKTEYTLLARVRCREVILARTQTVRVPSNSVMAKPQVTGTTQNQGLTYLSPGTSININNLPLSVWHP
ncbi:MAG: hypothetical protein E6Q98_16070 [Rhodospirillaceae bacterium]|nr:MAG: hypothetical protein E6Q98_16070 [Rhodospirillaceae bacterium]